MTALCFVDTETTGVHPERRAWEVAIIRRETNGTEQVFHTFISYVDLANADPIGLKIGGFYERHPEYAIDPVDLAELMDPMAPPAEGQPPMMNEYGAAARIERLTRGAHIVGAVPNFDTEVFAGMLRRAALIPAWHYHLIDVEALAVGYLCGRAKEQQLANLYLGLPWSSDDLTRACGVETATDEERHTALGDARWAMRLYDAIVHGTRAAVAL